jgi:hypothetical protein
MALVLKQPAIPVTQFLQNHGYQSATIPPGRSGPFCLWPYALHLVCLLPRKRIAFSTFIPARLARPPFSAWQEGGPERLAMAGRREVLKQ